MSNKRVKSEYPTRVWRNVSSKGVPQVCAENVTRVVFVFKHSCQHSGLWVSSCFFFGIYLPSAINPGVT